MNRLYLIEGYATVGNNYVHHLLVIPWLARWVCVPSQGLDDIVRSEQFYDEMLLEAVPMPIFRSVKLGRVCSWEWAVIHDAVNVAVMVDV